MPADDDAFTVGVEEEFLIIDPETRRLRPQADDVVPAAEEEAGDERVDPEFKRSQLETGSEVCRTLKEVRDELVRLRRQVMSAAERIGCRIGAAGTHPFSHWSEDDTTPEQAYIGLEHEYQRLAREKIICGCHVHVGMPDEEATVQTMNRVRPWLSAVLALAANSPYWQGEDTGYASFRTEIWRRWPSAGTPHHFESRAEYDELVEILLRTASIDDPARIHWDVRPSARFTTLEFRVADVCLTVDEAVAVAGLVRALAQTCHAESAREAPLRPPRPELLRWATWRAARYGLEDNLVEAWGGRLMPASRLLDELLDHVRPVLEERDEWDEVSGLVHETVARGTGAQRQRGAFARAERLEDVVDFVLEETVAHD